jgi:phosphoribosylcarboxyaminoimidazole (NCAIR) mutase
MKKILFLGAGSPKDPIFDNVPGIKYMERHGMTITKPMVIESCHGCHDLMTKYSEQMQQLVEEGNRVVAVLEGRLYFALPSIQATQVTLPIISCPLDFVAYQASMTPSGNATVATVGIERKLVGDTYKDVQRGKAIHIAEKILNLEEDTVDVCSEEDTKNLTERLRQFGIGVSDKSNLVLAYSPKPRDISLYEFQVWANPSLNSSNVNSIIKSEEMLAEEPLTVQVRSEQDLAIYAAKILSLRKPEIRAKIKEMSFEKRKSYQERNLLAELGGK